MTREPAPQTAAELLRRQCLKPKLYPDDIARVVLFFAADDGGACTNQNDIADDGWILNSLAVRPGRLIMPEGASDRTLDALARHGVEIVTLPYDRMQLNGGGIHCSTCPLVRDPVG